MNLYQHQFDTTIGRLYYVWDGQENLCYLGNDIKRLDQFKKLAKSSTGLGGWPQLEEEIYRYLAGQLKNFKINTKLLYGSPFFRKVLDSLKTIGYGQMVSYRELAGLSGSSKAWRAVGTVMGKNPIMIIIPCHRVIKSSGQAGNYSAGIPIKHFLLQLESPKGH
ncbi:MAG: methylated-DNA--[protein]-cysteine S-methyltransferase [Actinomycetota bacterium]|nr:methylated-DNA--[protein]-cysteine S-methyltransferase [Actinomycetota bacterium]